MTARRRRCARRSAYKATRTPAGIENRAKPAQAASKRDEIAEGKRCPAALRAAEQVDDASKEHGLGELRRRQGEIGENEKDSQIFLAAEQAEDPQINGQDRHEALAARDAALSGET